MMSATVMVRQYFDNAALGDFPPRTSSDHPPKLCLERSQAGDALLHFGQPRTRNLISLVTVPPERPLSRLSR